MLLQIYLASCHTFISQCVPKSQKNGIFFIYFSLSFLVIEINVTSTYSFQICSNKSFKTKPNSPYGGETSSYSLLQDRVHRSYVRHTYK